VNRWNSKRAALFQQGPASPSSRADATVFPGDHTSAVICPGPKLLSYSSPVSTLHGVERIPATMLRKRCCFAFSQGSVANHDGEFTNKAIDRVASTHDLRTPARGPLVMTHQPLCIVALLELKVLATQHALTTPGARAPAPLPPQSFPSSSVSLPASPQFFSPGTVPHGQL
jgi:hypothetical protein